MNIFNLKNIFPLIVLMFVCFGCSAIDSLKKSGAENNKPGENNSSGNSAPNGKKPETASASPCDNKYNPVKDGSVKNYKMSIGSNDAKITQQYTPGASDFIEEMTIGGTTVKHHWECTDEGLIAANPGSMLNSKSMQIEPKHISGVTLPKDSEIQLGKTWTTVYQATGKSPLGEISANLTLNNKVVSLDDEVKVPAGTFKAVKIETNLDMEMKMGGKNIPVPAVKTYQWFAPGVGMVKNAADGSFGNSTMEYAGDK